MKLSENDGNDNTKAVLRTGTVKWFDEKVGYGFIEQENGRDLFVHYKELRGKLNAGDKVQYILGEGRKGPAATKVKVLERAAPISDAEAAKK